MSFQLTKEQQKQFQKAFQQFDKNKDGSISIDQLGDIMKQLGQNPTKQQLQKTLNEIDADGNQTIDFSEFLHLMKKKIAEVDLKKQLILLFQKFDTNKNGKLSAVELKEMLISLGQKQITQEQVNLMIKEADYDGDSLLSCDQFVKIMTIGRQQ